MMVFYFNNFLFFVMKKPWSGSGCGFSDSLDPDSDSATFCIRIQIQRQPGSGFGFSDRLDPDPTKIVRICQAVIFYYDYFQDDAL